MPLRVRDRDCFFDDPRGGIFRFRPVLHWLPQGSRTASSRSFFDQCAAAQVFQYVERQLKLNPNDSCGTHSPVVNLSQHNRREGPYRLCWERMMTSRFGRGTIHFLIVVELNYSCRQTQYPLGIDRQSFVTKEVPAHFGHFIERLQLGVFAGWAFSSNRVVQRRILKGSSFPS